MTIETVNYISDLDETQPTRDNMVDEGDDHLRVVKHGLKETFPNINKAVTVTAKAINALVSNIIINTTDIDLKGNALVGVVSKNDPDAIQPLSYNDSRYIKPGDVIGGSLFFTTTRSGSTALVVNANTLTTNKIRIVGKNIYMENSPGAGGVGSFEANYPVGTIYKSATSGTNPASVFGFGTWVPYSPGRALVGSGGGFSLGVTYGSKTHTLSIAEMGPHNHADFSNANGNPPGNKYQGTATSVSRRANSSSTSGGGIGSAGGGAPHNNLQPYEVEMIWMRTA